MKQMLLSLLLILAPPALAEGLMTAEEFDAYTRGKTLFYGKNGNTYGAEIYRDNRRVTWSFLDGLCKEGTWYPDNGMICFVYEDNTRPQCWSFEKGTGGLVARFENSQTTTELYEARNSDEEMICLGPEVGV